MLAHAEFQHAYVHNVLPLGYTYGIAKLAERLCGITSPAHTADGRHTGVVPAAYMLFVYQLQQLALAHYRIGKVATGKLVLLGREYPQLLYEPVIQRSVVYELQRAYAVCYLFNAIALPVREIVHRVDAPFVARAVVVFMLYAVHQRVAHQQVGVRHIYFSAQRFFAIFVLTIAHLAE